MKNRLLWFMLMALFLSSANADLDFTDAQAKHFLEEWLDEGCDHAFGLGRVLLQVGEIDMRYPDYVRRAMKDGRVIHQLYGAYTDYVNAMEDRGIIKVEQLWADPSKKWQDANVVLTQKGKALLERWNQPEEEEFCVKWGSGHVAHVGRNEVHPKGLDIYKVVMALFEITWTPEHLHFQEVFGLQLSGHRKIVALFKQDPFRLKWEMVTYDVANLDEEFMTTSVTEELARE